MPSRDPSPTLIAQWLKRQARRFDSEAIASESAACSSRNLPAHRSEAIASTQLPDGDVNRFFEGGFARSQQPNGMRLRVRRTVWLLFISACVLAFLYAWAIGRGT